MLQAFASSRRSPPYRASTCRPHFDHSRPLRVLSRYSTTLSCRNNLGGVICIPVFALGKRYDALSFLILSPRSTATSAIWTSRPLHLSPRSATSISCLQSPRLRSATSTSRPLRLRLQALPRPHALYKIATRSLDLARSTPTPRLSDASLYSPRGFLGGYELNRPTQSPYGP